MILLSNLIIVTFKKSFSMNFFNLNLAFLNVLIFKGALRFHQ